MSEYLPILMLMVLATLFAAGSFMGARVLVGRRPNSAKTAPYECGIVPSAAPPERFDSPFSDTSDYVLLDGYKYGGEKYFLTLRHRPHYVLIQVKPALFEEPPAGLKPQPDLTADTTTIVMVRDLGHLRLPPFLVMAFSGLVFGVCCWNLHERDKEIMRARATALATT